LTTKCLDKPNTLFNIIIFPHISVHLFAVICNLLSNKIILIPERKRKCVQIKVSLKKLAFSNSNPEILCLCHGENMK